MANEENLKKGKATQFKSGEEAARKGRQGGIKSGESKRNRKILRECLDILLENPVYDKNGKFVVDRNGKKMTGAEVMATKLFHDFLKKGELKAFELIRDTAGQKPADKIVVADIDPAVIEEVEMMVTGDGE